MSHKMLDGAGSKLPRMLVVHLTISGKAVIDNQGTHFNYALLVNFIPIAAVFDCCCLFAGGMIMTQTTPVSYTHLRAHETLRYLVCRLLLEKKKK